MLNTGLKRAVALGLLTAMLAVIFAAGDFVTGASAATKSVIVQLKGDPVVVAKAAAEAQGREFDELAYRQQIIAAQDEFLNQLAASGVEFSVAGVDAPNGPNNEVANIAFRFNYVYNGVTLNVPESAVPAIEAMPQVESVHASQEIELHLDNGVKYTRAPSLYGNPPQVKMGDELRTGGVHGEGINIAIIDTGVDWAHPMFGGDLTPPQFGVGPAVAAAGPNRKVTYYMNYTAGAVTDDLGHGTHVAGIAAGYLSQAPGPDGLPLTADDVKIHGVAPQAKIMGYKVLSTVGAGASPSIIMAIEDAVQPFTVNGYPKPVAHVINMSLGIAINDTNYPTSVASDNATLAGATVVASAGNSGAPTPTNPTGEGTIGSPGTGRRVLTVGSNNDPGPPATDLYFTRLADDGRYPDRVDVLDPAGVNRSGGGLVDGTDKALAAGQRTNIPLDLGSGSPAIAGAVAQYYVFAGTVATAADVPDSVAGRIAIARPSGAFGAVANALAAKGAAAALIIYPTNMSLVHSAIPTWSIQDADARYLLDLLSSSDTPGVDPAKGALSEYPVRLRPGPFSPAMATTSSKGPVTGFGMIKPDVTAPGMVILSATVRAGGVGTNASFMFHPTGYISASGTSMSSPMTAGAAALVKQKNPSWTPSMIRAALMNTATNLRRADGTPVPDGTQTLNQQGAGLIDAFAAANAKALMGAGQIDTSEGSTGPRPNQLCPNYGGNPSPLCGSSPGNPDFLGSHSFGAVQIAGVIGTATVTRQVSIYDISEGAGAGTYRLSSSAVRNMGEVQISFTDADGNPVSEVTVPAGGAAHFNVTAAVSGEKLANPMQIEWYVMAARADGGQSLRMPFQLRAVAPVVATGTPVMGDISGTEMAGDPPVDTDGNYTLNYSYAGSNPPSKFRVQESKDGGATWATLAEVPAEQTTYDVTDRQDGTHQYRVVGLFSAQYGHVAGPPSGTKGVRVSRPREIDATAMIQTALSKAVFGKGTFEFDGTLKNITSGTTLQAPMRFIITSINSPSGNVRVTNADNGGDGVAGHAIFDFSNQLGADGALSPSETSGERRLKFTNPLNQKVEIIAIVKAYASPAAAQAPAGSVGTAGDSSTASGGGGTTGTADSQGDLVGGIVGQLTATIRITVDPLTQLVGVSLVQ